MSTLQTEVDHKPAAAVAVSKAQLDRQHEELWCCALAAGQVAGYVHKPEPMIVSERASPLDDNSPIVKQWEVDSGVCGFAWVSIRPATSSFARWLVKQGLAHKAYEGGLSIWISDYNQSMERKEAHARAMAEVFRAAGVNAYAASRMD
jgi:hypothetical protein